MTTMTITMSESDAWTVLESLNSQYDWYRLSAQNQEDSRSYRAAFADSANDVARIYNSLVDTLTPDAMHLRALTCADLD